MNHRDILYYKFHSMVEDQESLGGGGGGGGRECMTLVVNDIRNSKGITK